MLLGVKTVLATALVAYPLALVYLAASPAEAMRVAEDLGVRDPLLGDLDRMMTAMEHPDLVALGERWIAAWNSHDLDRVLALYAEDAEMTSDGIVRLGFTVQGSVRGKQNLRAYSAQFTRIEDSLSDDRAKRIRRENPSGDASED